MCRVLGDSIIRPLRRDEVYVAVPVDPSLLREYSRVLTNALLDPDFLSAQSPGPGATATETLESDGSAGASDSARRRIAVNGRLWLRPILSTLEAKSVVCKARAEMGYVLPAPNAEPATVLCETPPPTPDAHKGRATVPSTPLSSSTTAHAAVVSAVFRGARGGAWVLPRWHGSTDFDNPIVTLRNIPTSGEVAEHMQSLNTGRHARHSFSRLDSVTESREPGENEPSPSSSRSSSIVALGTAGNLTWPHVPAIRRLKLQDAFYLQKQLSVGDGRDDLRRSRLHGHAGPHDSAGSRTCSVCKAERALSDYSTRSKNNAFSSSDSADTSDDIAAVANSHELHRSPASAPATPKGSRRDINRDGLQCARARHSMSIRARAQHRPLRSLSDSFSPAFGSRPLSAGGRD
eukprot:Opistho-1_new@73694